MENIEEELQAQSGGLHSANGQACSKRSGIEQRTHYDIEMLREIGFCTRHRELFPLLRRPPAGRARRLRCWTTFRRISCSLSTRAHVTLPQIRAHVQRRPRAQASAGGLRLPPALARSTTGRCSFDEFEQQHRSAHLRHAPRPAPYELERAGQVVEQIIRPTGLIDPGNRRSPRHRAGGRPATARSSRRTERRLSRAGHDADQEDGREPDHLSART